jgi:hypothetical protein
MKEFDQISVTWDNLHGERNYTIRPRSPRKLQSYFRGLFKRGCLRLSEETNFCLTNVLYRIKLDI